MKISIYSNISEVVEAFKLFTENNSPIHMCIFIVLIFRSISIDFLMIIYYNNLFVEYLENEKPMAKLNYVNP